MKDNVRIVSNAEQVKLEKELAKQPKLTEEDVKQQIDELNKLRKADGLDPINIDQKIDSVEKSDDFSISFDVCNIPSASKVHVEDDLGFVDTEKADELAESIQEITEDNIKEINIEEHDSKYNVDKDDLKAANEKMANNSRFQKNNKDDIVVKDGIKMHKRTKKQYEQIWNAFVERAAKEFEEIMGYGVKSIKKIGYKKFIDAMDWRSPDDIFSFKTDKWHVIICPSCSSEFGIYEENVGLCKNCLPKYDMERFWDDYAKLLKNNPADTKIYIGMFLTSNEFREKYKKVTMIELLKKADDEKFAGKNTFRFLVHLLTKAVQEMGDKKDGFRFFIEALQYHMIDCKATRIRHKTEARNLAALILDGVSESSDWKNAIHKNIICVLKIKTRPN